MDIREASEMYLETILTIERRKGEVHSVDVASELGYSRPSVSEQAKKLRKNGYLEMDEHGHLLLTASGRAIAERIYERHNVIAGIFIGLGVDERIAYRDACRVEHYISQQTFERMKEHYTNANGVRDAKNTDEE